MEICGIPSNEFVDKCRKKEHYFDVDYSPFLIEEEEQGILRIPESKTLEQVVRCEDRHFIDFLKRCLELDPDLRFGAREASEHPWLKQQDVVATGTRAEWAQLSSLGDSSSISQDEVFKEGGEGLTAPDDMDGLYDLGGDRTRQEIRGSERQYLFIQESS
jgi:serine/threonine protein kinase